MKVSDLITQLQRMPQELQVMLLCEGNLDYAMGVGIVQVAKTKHDWSGTPIGNYRQIEEMYGYEPELETGQTFPVALIHLEEIRQQP
jgi:hypothetical protein